MDDRRFKEELEENPEIRVPVIFLVDTSGSMNAIVSGETTATGETGHIDGRDVTYVTGGVSRLDRLVEGVNYFYDAIRRDNQASRAVDLCILGFSDDTQILREFSNLGKDEVFEEPATGNLTNMGAAVHQAMDMLSKRRKEYRKAGRDYFQPWLVIFTDGIPTDEADVKTAQKRTVEQEELRRLVVFPFYLDERVDPIKIAGFTKKRPPLEIKQERLEAFFEWLSKSIESVSSSGDPDKEQRLLPIDAWYDTV